MINYCMSEIKMGKKQSHYCFIATFSSFYYCWFSQCSEPINFSPGGENILKDNYKSINQKYCDEKQQY